ncbi:MAG: flagellin [Planctomycetota bacterium]
MTRINTNVNSLVAQNRLQNSNNDLQQSLTRLSTGLRINKGSDDPAGLLASEALRSEITGISKSISNTQRASQIISTADSALGQVSNLLNDIRGLVVEAGNSGALSDEEIAANQLQIDSSLEAINRIAQTTTFQGRKLLDGSLDFVSTIGSVNSVSDVSIDQANLGTTGQIDVEVVVSTAATQATSTASSAAFTTAAAATVDSGVTFGSATQDINGEDIEIVGEGLTSITIVDDVTASNSGAASFDSTTGVLTITANFTGVAANTGEVAADVDAQDVETAIAALDGFTASGATAAGTIALATAATVTDEGEGLTITANNNGADYNNVAIKFVEGAANAADYDTAQKVLTVTVNNSAAQTGAALKAIIDDATVDGVAVADDLFTATVITDSEFAAAGQIADLDTGTTGGEVLRDDLVFELSGASGAETFNFGTGTSIDQIANAVNLVSDSTGVSAAGANSALTFTSTDYGSEALVAIDVISEGATGTFETSLDNVRSTGTDIAATINGVEANGSGNELSINTATLDLSLTVTDGSNENFSFSITGGGATFQLGPEVISNQQASLGIGSVSTGQLGGAAGRLYELGSGQAKSLSNDVAGAAEIIDEVIAKVTQTRGRLGSFQSTTLESNLVSLNDAKANLQEAESSIRDADFAQESANLTRAQILVQSGTNVLALANQNPQNVLALLR